jgi:beta-mannosidase
VTDVNSGSDPAGRVRPLHDGWTLRLVAADGVPDPLRPALVDVPASVPGCVHTDLLGAGLIDDPFVDDNEKDLSWIGRARWRYDTRFEWRPDGADRVELVCAGLDTVATVTLNDVELGRTRNMHRGYRFDVTAALRPGANALSVTFESAYGYAQALRERLGPRPAAYRQPFNFIRKMACNFGWDWGPTLVTAGVWQPIGLESWSVARLGRVRPLVTVTDGRGRVEVHVDLDRTATPPVVVTATVDGRTERVRVASDESTATVTLTVDEPRLWWPRGLGPANLYPLTVILSTEDGIELGRWERRVGFRSVRLDTTADEHGTPYTLHVNDVPVFVRGANWIPDDPFPTRVGRERYATRLGQAADANVNFLRIWGGGRYESDDLYDVADELGLLVGQDFLFACAAYPEESPLREEVVAEAVEQVVRLAPHPSLVTWTGNNENIWGFADWDWAGPLEGRTWGAGYYFDVLPRIVAELDPTRPYWPGSPYSGRRDLHPNDPAHGSTHIWDVWNSADYTRYRHYRPRFVAEFGYQAPPAYATLRRVLSDSPLAPDSPGMAHHQKAIDGDLKLARGLAAHLPEPHDFDDWHYLTQINQARAVQVGVEHFRSLRGLCMGAIVWQLNDCWPVTSWAAVDGDGRRKPLWYMLRRVYADRLLTVQPAPVGAPPGPGVGDGALNLVAVNDGDEPWSAQVDVARLSLDGEPLAKTTVDLNVAPRSVRTAALPREVALPERSTAEVLLVDSDGHRAWWFFGEDRDLAYPSARFDAAVEPVPGGYRVSVTARTILRDLSLFPDRLDPAATVDDAMVTLLPGETAHFTVGCPGALDADALSRRPVLRCVNDIAPGAAPYGRRPHYNRSDQGGPR